MPFTPPSPPGQPNAIDVAQLVNKFKNLAGALLKATTQLQPNLPELNADINALDIVAVVDAVKKIAYPFLGPCACPSTVTCGVTACTTDGPCVTAYGPASKCVKTCVGGSNAGDTCKDDAHGHCPSGTCGNTCSGGSNPGAACTSDANCTGGGHCTGGYCRDRCGRCTP